MTALRPEVAGLVGRIIAASVELKRLLGDDHEVVLVDRKPEFTMGLRKLWALVGHGTLAEGSRPRALLGEHGVRVVEEEIRSIDPAARAAETTSGRIDGDRSVIALGAQSGPDLVPASPSTGTTSGRSPASRRRRGARAIRRRPPPDPDRGRSVPLPAGARTSAASISTGISDSGAFATGPTSLSSRSSRC